MYPARMAKTVTYLELSPKALREPGARYVVEAVHPSKSGGFYRAFGDIKKLVER